MVKSGDKVSCGDTEDCEECDSGEGIKASTKGEKVLTVNDKGRCDFYSGPSDDIEMVTVKRPR